MDSPNSNQEGQTIQDVNWRGYWLGAWGGIAVLLVSFVVALFQQHWVNIWVFAGFLLGGVLYLVFENWLPSFFDALFIWAIVINAAGWSWGLYHQVSGYDEFAHALGTLAVTLIIGLYGYQSLLAFFRSHFAVMALAIISLGIAVGAIWEVLEWLGYFLFTPGKVQALNDKISDIVLDGLGAMLAVPLLYWALQNPPSNWKQRIESQTHRPSQEKGEDDR